jgi:HD-GYP domain-containing protein (c-di-GMP phosphodiesterase class II)
MIHHPRSDTYAPESNVIAEAIRMILEQHQESPAEMLRSLVRMIAARNRELAEHGIRTACYARRIGETVGLSANNLATLHAAALVHDIGQLVVPARILYKATALTADEYALFQSHPRIGSEFLWPIPALREAATWIALHHERWDGFGYPYGLRGAFIPLESRILAVADTFDAALSGWYTHVPRDIPSASRLLQQQAGAQLDPELVGAFVQDRIEPPVIEPGRFHGQSRS